MFAPTYHIYSMPEVEIESAITLFLRRNPNYANEHSRRCLVTRPPGQRKPCWTIQDKTEMIDTYLREWVCPPIYIITRPSITENCPEGEDHVFDGAHKLEAIFDFMNDEFALKYKDITKAIMSEYNGKKFSDLPREIREKIRKYKFHINIVDEDTASDVDVLRVLWERVNRAGKRLNDYEINIPMMVPLLDKVIRPCLPSFFKTPLFPKEESNRGALEQKIQTLLAIADYSGQKINGNSLPALINDWHRRCMGTTMQEREANVEKNHEVWCDTLNRAVKIMADLVQENTFCDEEGDSIVEEAQRTDLLMVLGRLVRVFPRMETFRSQKKVIAARLKTEIFERGSMEFVAALGCKGRNWTFQRKLIAEVDRILTTSAEAVQPRLFTREQKETKLAQQGGMCTLCQKKILPHHLFDGDHIVEWCEGGATTMENLQILHRHCHQAKGATA